MSVRIAGAIVGLVVGAFALFPAVSMAGALTSKGVERGPMIPGGIEVSRAPYQESVINAACNAVSVCLIDFTPVPVKSRLEITNASCYVVSDHELDGIQLGVIKPNNSQPFLMLLEPGYHTSSAPYETSANDQVNVFANAGQHIELLAAVPNTFHISTLVCSISGTIVKLKK